MKIFEKYILKYLFNRMSSNDLKETMGALCISLGKDLVKFNVNVMAVEGIINAGFNKSDDCVTNFDTMELIEEKMDEMIYIYQFIKDKFKKGRHIREKIEETTEKKNDN
jgi:hypothetical protein